MALLDTKLRAPDGTGKVPLVSMAPGDDNRDVAKVTKVASKKLYRVRFLNEGRIFELYAREVGQGGLFGFIEVADLVWGSKSEVIIDPGEQELRNEFNGVNRLHVPMHAMVRIDEVEKGGSAKIIQLQAASGSKTATPVVPIYTPGGGAPVKPK
jgi:hypothetical protein